MTVKIRTIFQLRIFTSKNFLALFSTSVVLPNIQRKKTNPIENGTRIPHNKSSIQDSISCCLVSLAVLCILSSSDTGQVHFMGKKNSLYLHFKWFSFLDGFKEQNETLLLKCIIQISGLDYWHFCALAGKGAATKLMDAAEVLLQGSDCLWGCKGC